jgi:hypothetical protein
MQLQTLISELAEMFYLKAIGQRDVPLYDMLLKLHAITQEYVVFMKEISVQRARHELPFAEGWTEEIIHVVEHVLKEKAPNFSREEYIALSEIMNALNMKMHDIYTMIALSADKNSIETKWQDLNTAAAVCIRGLKK